ncbi:hypothetical protein GUJ93_ZPchr0002g26519 [Zizania palustris]|uniref:Uncharacterized protein n=1 Tax=Zizania palustris TaxID=103762 RepID=A0A8J5V3W6_ZIZPA|nr:hypothetical protein GUJ93_ZPchr0002g26519 [Zizania palustris]
MQEYSSSSSSRTWAEYESACEITRPSGESQRLILGVGPVQILGITLLGSRSQVVEQLGSRDLDDNEGG